MDTEKDSLSQGDVNVQYFPHQTLKLIELLTAKTNLVASLNDDKARLEAELDATTARHGSDASTSAKDISDAIFQIQGLEKWLEDVGSERHNLQAQLDELAISFSQAQRQISTLSLALSTAEVKRCDDAMEKAREEATAGQQKAKVAEEATKIAEAGRVLAEKRAFKTEQELQQATSDTITNQDRDIQEADAKRKLKATEKQKMDVFFCVGPDWVGF